MATAPSIDEAQVLFDLPTPLEPSTGRTWLGTSHGITGPRKRKRPEIAVGVDTASINIYSVGNPALLVSHAIAPHAYLTAHPSCVYRRATKRRQAQRFVYVATRSNLSSSPNKVTCFEETLAPAPTALASASASVTSHTIELGSVDDPVIHIEVIPAQVRNHGPAQEVILVQRSGLVSCRSSDLQSEKWGAHTLDSYSLSKGKDDIRQATLCDAATLSTGLLNAHPEILANLTAPNASVTLDGVQVLCLITSRPDGTVSCQLCHVRPSASIASGRSGIHSLAKWDLPKEVSEGLHSAQGRLSVDCRSGLLQVTCPDQILTCDMTTTIPSVHGRITTKDSNFTSSTNLVESLSFVCTETHSRLYDLRYQSLCSQNNYRNSLQTQGRKRKRSDISSNTDIVNDAVFFTKARLVVGVAGSRIVTFKINLSSAVTRGKRTKISRLIDSIGKGITNEGDRSVQGRGDLEKKEADWIVQKRTMDDAAQSNDMRKFQRLFEEVISGAERPSGAVMSQVAVYALGKIFQWTDIQPEKSNAGLPSIKIARMPSKTFHWLGSRGYIAVEWIQLALNPSRQDFDRISQLSPRDLVEAIALFDPSLILLSDVINEQSHLGLPGLVHAFKRLLQSFNSTPQLREDRLLTNGADTTNGTENDVSIEEQAAEREIDFATNLLEGGLKIRSQAMKTCLNKLAAAFHPTEVARAMRSHMTREDIMLLVDLLRVELTEGGWTTHILDATAPADDSDAHNEIIVAISALLNCAMDALGTGGWLTGAQADSGDHNRLEALIVSLRAETSAVLEGVQESSFFKGFLKDFLRYGEMLEASGKADEVGVPSESYETLEDSMLPLGVRQARPIAATRISAGGEVVRRSRRDIAYETTRSKGVYSFETIRV